MAAAGAVMGSNAAEQSPLGLKQWEGTIDFSTEKISTFTLKGTESSQLGLFTGLGEVDFLPGEEKGSLIGDGVVVLKAENGDLLVGVVSWDVEAEVDSLRTSQIDFSWRDSVKFSDGMSISSTGRFAKSQPLGLVVIAIIAILIGSLLPADPEF